MLRVLQPIKASHQASLLSIIESMLCSSRFLSPSLSDIDAVRLSSSALYFADSLVNSLTCASSSSCSFPSLPLSLLAAEDEEKTRDEEEGTKLKSFCAGGRTELAGWLSCLRLP